MSSLGSNGNPSNNSMTADDRYELAALASNQQRLNFPSHLITIGAIAVFASLIILFISWQSRSKAQSTYTKQSYKLVNIESLITQITTLEITRASSQDRDDGKPIPDMLSKLKRYATQAKLENELGLPRNPKSRPEGNARLMTYPYTLRDPSLEHLLNWIRISTDQIPGLSVTDLTIKPAKNDWSMSVTLSRYERNE